MYFTDYFQIDPRILYSYGAFNVSLEADLPLFIDPFLLFNSKKAEYQKLHTEIITYIRFLRDKSAGQKLSAGLIKTWYQFPEIKQNWLGFTRFSNRGSGLGREFAKALHENLTIICNDFGDEKITQQSHLEKLCLIKDGVGRDTISDFTTNLIKGYLLEYTQTFALQHLRPDQRARFGCSKVRFNYETESWEVEFFELPLLEDDYVILTPIDMLTRGNTWINKEDLIKRFYYLPEALSDEGLRDQINNYLNRVIPLEPTQAQEREGITKTLQKFPILADYYIKDKELKGDEASAISKELVDKAQKLFVTHVAFLVQKIMESPDIFEVAEGGTLSEAKKMVRHLKWVIENRDGYRIFYDNQGLVRLEEEDLQILYDLTWSQTISDVNREVNNGRGPVDFKVSRGALDKSLVEFKLASNSQLKRNLQNQVEVYKEANDVEKAVKVVIFFTQKEKERVLKIINDLGLKEDTDVILIDARNDNKKSASKV
ncbi:MAG: hypothetical protein K0Q50_933 [Vampirovibrio sp.]|jgi:hypothetical protein|nr:hypothetical protein [Vampirovibrio sp.]